MFSNRKVWLSIAWAVALLLAAEMVLQVRAYIRYGSSVFHVLSEEGAYYRFDDDFGLKLLRPNHVVDGTQATVVSNALGLRSPELPLEKPEEEFRVAVLGASTVMGTYTRYNEETLPYRLQYYLQERFPRKSVRVINGGIAGYGIDEQRRMLQSVLGPFDLDLVVWYPGFNDIAGYCRQTEKTLENHALPELVLPGWLLIVELIVKNTVWLRNVDARRVGMVEPSSLDLDPYRQKVDRFLAAVQALDVAAVVVTNARAFRRNMSHEEQMRLSETARYYHSCFDLAGLHEVFDIHNGLLVDAARKRGIPVVRLDQALPGGDEYFGDAAHFSTSGTDYAARLIAEGIHSRRSLLGPEWAEMTR